MTGKERAALRAQANGLVPLFQVGKGGISDALIKQTDDALEARELIKLKVLLRLPRAAQGDCKQARRGDRRRSGFRGRRQYGFLSLQQKLHEKQKNKR